MNKLSVVVGVVVWMAVIPAWAGDDAPPGKGAENSAQKAEQFKMHKAMQVQMLEEKLTCIKAANSTADMKRCHEAQKARQQDEKLKRIQEQRKKLDEREKMLKEKQMQTNPATP